LPRVFVERGDFERHLRPIPRKNALLDELMATEVGVSDGHYLPQSARPARPQSTSAGPQVVRTLCAIGVQN